MIRLFLLGCALFFICFTVFASQADIAYQQVALCDYGMCVGKVHSVEGFAENVIKFLARVIATLAVLTFMAGGFLLMIAFDEDRQRIAKQIMMSSVIAVVVVLGSYVLVSFVQQVLYSLGN